MKDFDEAGFKDKVKPLILKGQRDAADAPGTYRESAASV